MFPDDKSKAEAFDKIAKMFYYGNFTTAPKSEIELMMFSIYMDGLYAQYDEKSYALSDCAVGEALGLTPSRVAGLKEKMAIRYWTDFDWKAAFGKEIEKVEYNENDKKVHINISDMRLYVALRKELAILGSYSETTLTKQMLVVSLGTFVDLMVEATPEEDRKKLTEKLGEILRKNQVNSADYLEKKKTIGEIMRKASKDTGKQIIVDAIKLIPIIGGGLSTGAEDIIEEILKKYGGEKK